MPEFNTFVAASLLRFRGRFFVAFAIALRNGVFVKWL